MRRSGPRVKHCRVIHQNHFWEAELMKQRRYRHSSLTQDNIDDRERVQKSALKLILQENYKVTKRH